MLGPDSILRPDTLLGNSLSDYPSSSVTGFGSSNTKCANNIDTTGKIIYNVKGLICVKQSIEIHILIRISFESTH